MYTTNPYGNGCNGHDIICDALLPTWASIPDAENIHSGQNGTNGIVPPIDVTDQKNKARGTLMKE